MHATRLLDMLLFALAAIMAVGLAGAVAFGILHILWVGSPAGALVAQIAFSFGFAFGGALLLAFMIAAYEECHHMVQIKPTDPNEFGAEV